MHIHVHIITTKYMSICKHTIHTKRTQTNCLAWTTWTSWNATNTYVVPSHQLYCTMLHVKFNKASSLTDPIDIIGSNRIRPRYHQFTRSPIPRCPRQHITQLSTYLVMRWTNSWYHSRYGHHNNYMVLGGKIKSKKARKCCVVDSVHSAHQTWSRRQIMGASPCRHW